jgi:hypothetical protein
MAVYSGRSMLELTTSLSNMSRTFFSRMPLILEPDEFVAAFIAPEHVTKLREVEELIGFTGLNSCQAGVSSGSGVNLSLAIDFGIRPPIILPRYVVGGLQPTCPDHIRERIVHWVDERLRFGAAFGDAYDALLELNAICPDARTITTLFPCFPNILASISEDAEARTTKRAQALAQSKSVGVLPRLPREVKNRLQEVSAIVNSVALLKDAPLPETPRQHARLTRREDSSPTDTRYHIFDTGKPMQQARDASFL